jgi:hypothetical protein
LKNRPTKSKGKGKEYGWGGGVSKKIRLGAKGEIFTVDEKITRDTSKSFTKTV